jgi:hypothetical protein
VARGAAQIEDRCALDHAAVVDGRVRGDDDGEVGAVEPGVEVNRLAGQANGLTARFRTRSRAAAACGLV